MSTDTGLEARRRPNGQFGRKQQTLPDIGLGSPDVKAAADALFASFTASDPRLDIWRRYPDITEEEDKSTDRWACGEVSAEFADHAADQGWETEIVEADADNPWADRHVWVHLHRDGQTIAVDFTARQYHNLNEISRDPVVLAAPWPLTWDPEATPGIHPLMGSFTRPSQPHTYR